MIRPAVLSRQLQGSKTYLRPYGLGFGEAELRRVYAWSRDRELLRLSGGSPLTISWDEFESHFWAQLESHQHRRVQYAIFAREGPLIGRVGLFGLDERRRQAELGILVGDREYWGRGFGSDALHTFLAYVFDELGYRRIYLYTGVDNPRAQRAFSKVGFRELGVVRRLFTDLSARQDVHMELHASDLVRPAPADSPRSDPERADALHSP